MRPRLSSGSRTLLALALTLLAGPAAAEFTPFPVKATELPWETYFNQNGAPDVWMDRECNDNGDCWDVIRDGEGDSLERFGSDDTVSKLARARYGDRAYLLVEHSYDCGDDTCTDLLLFDHTGDETEVNPRFREHFHEGPLDVADLDQPSLLDLNVTEAGGLLALTSEGLIRMDRKGAITGRAEAPVALTHGRIQNDLAGRQAAIGVAEDNAVWLSNGRDWSTGGLRLAEHGDRNGVLAVHPEPDGTAVGAVYRYVNPYNKGLYLVRSGPGMEQPQHGPVVLSSERNVGFDPEIYPSPEGYLLLARDSSNEQRVAMTVPRAKVADLPQPEMGTFPQGEWDTTFWLGGGAMYQTWDANSEVSEGDRTLLKADYQIDQTLLWSAQFQGRIGSTRLALTYLKDQAKDKARGAASNQAEREATEYLIGSIDFEGLFSPSSGLRLGFRRSRTQGLAELSEPQNGTTSYEPFTVDYNRFGLYHTLERGWYWGLEYTRYRMPTAVGFSDASKDIVHTDFDSDFGVRKYSLVGGYDPEAYAKRYETNYHDWYVTGKAGMGIGKAALSSEVKEAAKQATGAGEINTPMFFAVDAMLEAGFLWQQRYRAARGLGYQVVVGYQGLGSFMGAGQSQESDTEDGLTLEFSRYDIWHGPFARLNVIF